MILVGEYKKVWAVCKHLSALETNGYTMADKTNVEMYVTTRDRIKEFGNMGEHYDDVLNKMMDACEPTAEFRQKNGGFR